VTDTIGWGEVDERPRRLPQVRLGRRRRIALVMVAALIAAGFVGWPSIQSWRADEAARHLQSLWARAQGFENARVMTLSGAQQHLGVMDTAAFAQAVVDIDDEAAADLDSLARRARALRTWTPDVATARAAVARAMSLAAAALRAEASRRHDIAVDFPVTTFPDSDSSVAADKAVDKMTALVARRHLQKATPATETYRSATAILQRLRRPTDDLLHLKLVAAGIDGVTVTDLDTGKVVVRRTVDDPSANDWQPLRVFGGSVVGISEGGTFAVPLNAHRKEGALPGYVQSSAGSPLWLSSPDGTTVSAFDESGRRVRGPFRIPANTVLTNFGAGTTLLVTDQTTGDFNGPESTPRYYLMDPADGRRTPLPITGCPEIPVLEGGLVVVATGSRCDVPSELELFDLSGRLVRAAPIPAPHVGLFDLPTCSPDGAHVAVLTLSPGSSPDGSSTDRVRVLDTRTGSWTTIAKSGDWLPVRWSSDSTTLLLQPADNFLESGGTAGLAYLRVGDPTLHSIRLASDQSNFLI
jgi:hypothetical protein